MFSLDTNAGEVAADLSGVVERATASADEEAARAALELVGPKTPRRSGRLAAGLRAVVAPKGGFDLVDAVPYANAVDARTGFATATLVEADATFAAIYDRHLQDQFDNVQ